MIEPTAFVTVSSQGDHVSISIEGEIDLSNADQIEEDITTAIPNHCTSASVDLTDVTYVDSVGMRVFFNLVAQLRTAQIELKVIAPPSSPARRIVDISGLNAVVTVEPV
ncbi:MAG TPA: STAS domain-containing protein [Acidimicrobiales bacterium]|nr:STAS domain-containing protein [Acidimicrobiales bacterium]